MWWKWLSLLPFYLVTQNMTSEIVKGVSEAGDGLPKAGGGSLLFKAGQRACRRRTEGYRVQANQA